MPELPEVETVRRILNETVVNKKIIAIDIRYNNIIANVSKNEFQKKLINQTIREIKRRGKWLIFVLDNDCILSHLRMEGKFFLKHQIDYLSKHEHVIFKFADGLELRYHDTRKFGQMYLLDKKEIFNIPPLSKLGVEPNTKEFNLNYLQTRFEKKRIEVKKVLLDQEIISGIGNIYANEILFVSGINPHIKANCLTKDELDTIIKNTNCIMQEAIKMGGTTIKSYAPKEGMTGLFQQKLLVHGQAVCKKCHSHIVKDVIGGRGTYYCPHCQNYERV